MVWRWKGNPELLFCSRQYGLHSIAVLRAQPRTGCRRKKVFGFLDILLCVPKGLPCHFVTAGEFSHVGRQPLLLGSPLQVQVVSHSGESEPVLQVQNPSGRNRRCQSLPCCDWLLHGPMRYVWPGG
jgi:hypothetical protein